MFYGYDIMKIAVLGWGSLIPHPTKGGKTLRIKGRWYYDGPVLPIEYARISGSNELTLVLHPKVKRVRTLWAHSMFDNLNKAIRNLRDRERIPIKATYRIGYVSIPDCKINSNAVHCVRGVVRKWALKKDIDAVIWTDLPENFQDKLRVDFSENEAITYLRNLTGPARDRARQYIQETPKQVVTRLRLRIEHGLGW